MDKKFNVNGRETEWCYLSYQEKIDLIRDENTTEEDRKFLIDKLLSSVEYTLCPKRMREKQETMCLHDSSPNM